MINKTNTSVIQNTTQNKFIYKKFWTNFEPDTLQYLLSYAVEDAHEFSCVGDGQSPSKEVDLLGT